MPLSCSSVSWTHRRAVAVTLALGAGRCAALGVVLLGGFASGGCGVGRPARDELVVLTEAPPASIDPRFAVGAYDFKLSRLCYAPLVSVDDATVEPKMELAESVVATSPTHWSVTLREARFSDGRPVTADDVVYTIESMRDPKTGSRLRQRFVDDGLVGLQAPDLRHVEFELSHPHAPFVTELDFGILARPVGPAPPGLVPRRVPPAARDQRPAD